MNCKAIEEKAILCFKEYILDSKIISQYLNENDKEPCWDGHIYLYSDVKKDKNHLIGRIPVQVKGIEVQKFVSKKYKFKVDMVDLKAYLYEPTIYIVCQEKKGSRERLLFYRSLTPETVKNILKGKEKQASIKILMHTMPEIEDFEKIMTVFYWDSKKQLGFADKPSFTFEEVIKQGISHFSFTVPERNMNKVGILSYLSSHPSYLYAKIDKPIELEIPISDGPMSFVFQKNVNKEIKVGNKVFYKTFVSNIKDGKIVLSLDKVITITFPLNTSNARMDFRCDFISLNNSIKAVEFILAIYEAKSFCIEDVVLHINTDGFTNVDELKRKQKKWKSLNQLFTKMHIKKDLDLTKVTDEQEQQIDLLLETMLNNNLINVGKQENSLMKFVIGNVNLLLWIVMNDNGMCMIGDFFNREIKLMYMRGNESIEASPFTYLQNNNLWEWCDNIPYDQQLESYQDIMHQHQYVYEMANNDLLAMLRAYDNLENKDNVKCNSLIEAISQLNQWLLKNDKQENFFMHKINQYQIIKRKRNLNDEEISKLQEYLNDKHLVASFKVGISLLLGDKQMFDFWISLCSKDEIKTLQSYPIWKYESYL